jgi:hypothetical protein
MYSLKVCRSKLLGRRADYWRCSTGWQRYYDGFLAGLAYTGGVGDRLFTRLADGDCSGCRCGLSASELEVET